MFETKGILNEKILEELSKYVISSKKRKTILISAFISALLGIAISSLGMVDSHLNLSFMIIGLCFFIFAFAAIFYSIYSPNIFLKANRDILGEVSDTNEIKIKVYFDEDGVIIDKLNLSPKTKIKYEFFNRILETPHTFFLLTKANQYALVFKECLNEDELNKFKQFIKGKCKNIK